MDWEDCLLPSNRALGLTMMFGGVRNPTEEAGFDLDQMGAGARRRC